MEEDRRNKLPANFEIRRRKAEWEQEEEELKKVQSRVDKGRGEYLTALCC